MSCENKLIVKLLIPTVAWNLATLGRSRLKRPSLPTTSFQLGGQSNKQTNKNHPFFGQTFTFQVKQSNICALYISTFCKSISSIIFIKVWYIAALFLLLKVTLWEIVDLSDIASSTSEVVFGDWRCLEEERWKVCFLPRIWSTLNPQ